MTRLLLFALLLTAAQAQLAARVADAEPLYDDALLPWTPEPAAVAGTDGWVDPTAKYAALKAERLLAERVV